jgi:hypothetical protein
VAGNSVEHAAEARAALHAIVSDPDHGVAALSDEKVLTSLLKDLLPDAPREAAILVAAAQSGVTLALRESVAQGLDAGTAIRLAAAAFAQATLFMPEACDWAASELALALGLSAAGDAGQPGTGAGAAVADAQAPVVQPPTSSAYQGAGGQAPMDRSPAGLAGAPAETAGQGFGHQPATAYPQGPRPAPGETATATPQGWPASPPGGPAPGKPRRTTAVLILAGAAVVIVAAVAFFLFGKSSPGPTRSGTETFALTSSSASVNPVYALAATGVFSATGTMRGIGNGQAASLAKFPGGTYVVNHPPKDAASSTSIDHTTCVEKSTLTGTYTLGKGTGAYTGITGSGTYDLVYTGTLLRHKNGVCDENNGVPVLSSAQQVMDASGPVTLP